MLQLRRAWHRLGKSNPSWCIILLIVILVLISGLRFITEIAHHAHRVKSAEARKSICTDPTARRDIEHVCHEDEHRLSLSSYHYGFIGMFKLWGLDPDSENLGAIVVAGMMAVVGVAVCVTRLSETEVARRAAARLPMRDHRKPH